MRLSAFFTLCLLACEPALAAGFDLERPEVRSFIDDVAARNHLDRAWVVRMVAAADSKPAIIDAMNKPAERARAWFEYRAIFLTDKRIREGREFIAAHREALDKIAQRSGVPGEVIAAIVGVETSYGHTTGKWRVLDALATLAFDYPARAAYFRGELEQFLLLSREVGFDPLAATGSYAGAMGAPQFMPRSYRSFAKDGDGDGRIDLWADWPDIFESVANYMVTHGWRRGEPLFATAELWNPDVEDLPGNRLDPTETVGSLAAKGVIFTTSLPQGASALFLALRNADAPTYRVAFHNFWVITRYNHSAMYALAVSELAAAIAASDGAPAAPTSDATAGRTP